MDEHDHHHHPQQTATTAPAGRLRRLYGRLKLTVLTFLASTGLIATSSVCPYCGQQACPINLGQAAGLGLFTALVVGLLTKLGIRKPLAVTTTTVRAPLSEEIDGNPQGESPVLPASKMP